MIEMEGLVKRFGDLVAVDEVTLTVGPGEVLALLGPNGAGKTTTVRMLSSILKPTSGSARVAGYDVATQGQEVRRSVGVLTEAPGLYTRMTGREYLDFFGRVRDLPHEHRAGRIQTLVEQFQMASVLDRRLGEYSKGMRQKIALIRTLLHDPPILLFDEPTSAMDPQSARLVRNAVLQLRDSDRRAILICTHNLPEAEELSDRIAIIRRGAIQAQGTVQELKAQMLGPPLMEVCLGNGSNGHHGATAPSGNGMQDAIDLISRFVQIDEVVDHRIRYRAPEPTASNPLVLRALAHADIPVVTLSEVPQSLEHVYLQVMDGEALDG
jgi:ABC-2 type transport system ATP-binding protein